jgi:hypothetical protein
MARGRQGVGGGGSLRNQRQVSIAEGEEDALEEEGGQEENEARQGGGRIVLDDAGSYASPSEAVAAGAAAGAAEPLSPARSHIKSSSSSHQVLMSSSKSILSEASLLRSFVEQIKRDPDDRNLWVELGMSILKKKNAKKVDLTTGTLLLQLAAEDEAPHDVDKRGADLRDADFWMSLAKAHFSIWLKDGIMAQEDRLEKAKIACETAFGFNENVKNELVWEMLISILLYSGELDVAKKSLEKMLGEVHGKGGLDTTKTSLSLNLAANLPPPLPLRNVPNAPQAFWYHRVPLHVQLRDGKQRRCSRVPKGEPFRASETLL